MIKKLNEGMDGKTLLDKSIELARRLYGYTANYEMSSESRMDLQIELSKLIAMVEEAQDYYLNVKKESKSRTIKRSIKEASEIVYGEYDEFKSEINEARIGRTKSVYVSQEYVPSYGWEDITVYDDMSPESLRLAKQDVKDYRDNGYNARYITRKLNNPDYVEPTYELSEEAVIDWLENECPYEYEIKDGMYGKWVHIGNDVSISLPDGPDSIFDNNIKITDNYERRTYRVNTLDELKKKVDRILKKREKIKADLIAAGYGNFVESTKVSKNKRSKKLSIKEGVRKPQYYDPELEQFEIFLMTNGREGQDEIRDYVDSRRDTNIFGSVGSEYNNISVWVNTENIDDTFVDEIENLITFAQDCGARINVACFNQLKDLFTVKHAPYDI